MGDLRGNSRVSERSRQQKNNRDRWYEQAMQLQKASAEVARLETENQQLSVKVASLEGQVQGYKDAISSHKCSTTAHLTADDLYEMTHRIRT